MAQNAQSRNALRCGGWLAIAGTVLSLLVNALHPHQDIPTDPFMHEVHHTDFWIPLHVGIVFAQILDMLAMLAIGRTLRASLRADLVRYADGAAVLAAAVMLVLMGQDGFTTKHLADYYQNSTGVTQQAAYPVAYAFLLLLLAGLGLWYLVFFGIAIPLYSFAMLRSSVYPRWLGLLGVCSGFCGLVTGTLIYALGSSFLVTTLMFLVFSVVGFGWLAAAGAYQLRAAKDAGGRTAPASGGAVPATAVVTGEGV